MPELSLRVQANAEDLRCAQDAVEAFGEEQAWPPAFAYQINLAIEEIGVNIVNYAYEGQEGAHAFRISVASQPDAVTIEVIDDGRPFDPLHDAPPPDLESDVDERPIGGLGVYFVRKMMDEVRYRREGGENHLTMVKRREAGA